MTPGLKYTRYKVHRASCLRVMPDRMLTTGPIMRSCLQQCSTFLMGSGRRVLYVALPLPCPTAQLGPSPDLPRELSGGKNAADRALVMILYSILKATAKPLPRCS